MAPDANFAHSSQPDGTDDRGNPLWLGQNLAALLAAAQDVALKRDQDGGTTKHLDQLLETLVGFAGGVGRLARHRARRLRPILSNVANDALGRYASPYQCPDCAEGFDSRDDYLNHAADVEGYVIERQPFPGWHDDQDDSSGPQG